MLQEKIKETQKQLQDKFLFTYLNMKKKQKSTVRHKMDFLIMFSNKN